jgi:monoamine oxidase
MSFSYNSLSRRSLLRAMAALAGAAAIPTWGSKRAHAKMLDLPPDFGRGRSVAIVGAGVSGLAAGWKLARAGYQVTIYEGADRYGGRSLTPRPSDELYKRWWFRKYNPEGLFNKMYVSEYQEDDRNPNAVKQVCKFRDDGWNPAGEESPVELFFNAGPGRIPSDHVELIKLCRETGVALEPYIFQSNYNLMQNDAFAGGEPFVYNRVNYSLRGAVAEMMAKLVQGGRVIEGLAPDRMQQMLEMLRVFGDLNEDYEFKGSSRVGYSHLPGGWRDAPVIKEPMRLGEILNSGFVGGGNPETSPGSFLFNADNIDWQNSLMQPVGGMDRVWQRLLVQEVPAAAVRMRNDDPREDELKNRQSRMVGDLVLLNHAITSMNDVEGENQVRIDWELRNSPGGIAKGSDVVDYCLSTMQPQLVAEVNSALPPSFKAILRQVNQTPAIKVGWQARYRFWEQENNIYGGISWTADPIGQIWYPSEDFNARTAVITGAYNRGLVADAFGKLDQERRIRTALNGGEKLHHGFPDKVYPERGLTIAWQYMPFQVGGWAGDTAYEQPKIYAAITSPPPSRIYFAGDTWSYLPGWQEGAITAAYEAIDRMSRAN